MPDMLVHLLKLPEQKPALQGITIRRAQPFELTPVRQFIEQHFSIGWADEATVGFSNKPVSVFLATQEGKILGFAAYETTRRGFFGPTGVAESQRGKGLGAALLIASLQGLRDMGYAYAIIGGAGPTDFYTKAVGAIPIENSTPGIYTDMLKPD